MGYLFDSGLAGCGIRVQGAALADPLAGSHYLSEGAALAAT